jgi:hypothetical protein
MTSLIRRVLLGGLFVTQLVVLVASRANTIDGVTVPTEATLASASTGSTYDLTLGTPCQSGQIATALQLLVSPCTSSAATAFYASHAVVNASLQGLNNVGSVGLTLTGKEASATGEATLYDGITVTSTQASGYLLISPNISGGFSMSCGSNDPTEIGECSDSVQSSYNLTINKNTYTLSNLLQSSYTLCAALEVEAGSFVNCSPAQENQTVFPTDNPTLIPFTFNQQDLFEFDMTVSATMSAYWPFGDSVLPDELDVYGTILASIGDPPLIQVLGPNMQPLSDAVITSVDGINYTGAPAPVPEPNSLLLLIAVASIVVVVQLRRKALITTA